MKMRITASAILIMLLFISLSYDAGAQGRDMRPHVSLKVWLPPLPRIVPPHITVTPPQVVFDGGYAPQPAYEEPQPQPYVQENYAPAYEEPGPRAYVQENYPPVYVQPQHRYYAQENYRGGCAPRYERRRYYGHENYRGNDRYCAPRYYR